MHQVTKHHYYYMQKNDVHLWPWGPVTSVLWGWGGMASTGTMTRIRWSEIVDPFINTTIICCIFYDASAPQENIVVFHCAHFFDTVFVGCCYDVLLFQWPPHN